MKDHNSLGERQDNCTSDPERGTELNTTPNFYQDAANVPGKNFDAFDAAAKVLLPGYGNMTLEARSFLFKFRKFYGCGGIYKKAVEYIKGTALFEERNISIILHAGLSAFSGQPINVVLIAPPSEGKTHVITNALSVFPDEYVSIYRDASPKSFTRERGQSAMRVIINGVKEYKTTIFNEFTGEETTIESYLRWLKSEIQKKGIEKEVIDIFIESIDAGRDPLEESRLKDRLIRNVNTPYGKRQLFGNLLQDYLAAALFKKNDMEFLMKMNNYMHGTQGILLRMLKYERELGIHAEQKNPL